MVYFVRKQRQKTNGIASHLLHFKLVVFGSLFGSGKAKVNMEVDPGERMEKVKGFKETSPLLSPDTVEKDLGEEDQEGDREAEGEEGEEDSSLELHTNPDASEEDTALSPVSGGSTSPSNQRDSNKSSVGQGGQASSRGHLSSCSAIMATDQLALKPVVSEEIGRASCRERV